MLLISQPCNSQLFIGANAGTTFNYLNTNITNRTYTVNEPKYGYCGGLNVKYHLTGSFNLASGVLYAQKNYSFVRTNNYAGIFHTTTSSYLQIPVLIQLQASIKTIEICLNAGVYGAYWLYAYTSGVMPNILNSTNRVDNNGEIFQKLTLTQYSEKYQFSYKRDNRLEYGLQTGVTVNFNMKNNAKLFCDIAYMHSLTDTQKQYMANQTRKTNQTIGLSLGYLMQLHNGKK